jgi:hypothetical protein
MTTTTHSKAILAVSAALCLTAIAINVGAPSAQPAQRAQEHEDEGYVETHTREQEPDAIEAAFARESYRRAETASLRFFGSYGNVRMRIYRVGPEEITTTGDKEMQGVPVTPTRVLGRVRPSRALALKVGRWDSGLYFAKLTSPGRVGYAPFVVAPSRMGERAVAIVMPTRTWQAYNHRDDDTDGRSDTWYAGGSQARLARPYLNRGVPPFFRRYDLRFIRWLEMTGKQVDVLAQEDLDTATPAALGAYRLIVFPGHHEYVTKAEFDAIEGYKNLGGNLAFLSANNFFWRIDVRGDMMTRIQQWRKLGRPESRLIGVQYNGNDRGERRGPWLVRETPASRWLFAGVELETPGEFASGGIEIDTTTAASPRNIQIAAEIPDLLGPGRTAQMTYYETKSGARVFAAGAFSLAGSVWDPSVAQLLENVWARLTEEAL